MKFTLRWLSSLNLALHYLQGSSSLLFLLLRNFRASSSLAKILPIWIRHLGPPGRPPGPPKDLSRWRTRWQWRCPEGQGEPEATDAWRSDWSGGEDESSLVSLASSQMATGGNRSMADDDGDHFSRASWRTTTAATRAHRWRSLESPRPGWTSRSRPNFAPGT